MTPQQKTALSKVGGLGAIVIFTMGADWAIERFDRRAAPGAPEVTHTRFVAESLRNEYRWSEVLSSLRSIQAGQTEMTTRLREICERGRIGCR